MKKTIAMLLSTVIVLCLIICEPLQSYANNGFDNSTVSIKIAGVESKDVLSQICVTIYSSTLSFFDEDAGYKEYENKELYNMSFDENGMIEIDRPSDFFLLSIDLTSLPEGFGITELSYFFGKNDNSYQFQLFKIDRIEIIKENSEYYPQFFSSNNIQIYSDYSLCLKNIEYVDLKEDNCLEFSKSITVEYNGKLDTEKVVEQVPYNNDLEKSEILFDNDYISYREYVQSIAEYILNENHNKQYDYDGTGLYWKLANYINSLSDDSSSGEISKAVSLLSNESDLNRSEAYVNSASGHFRVYYESADSNISQAAAQAVADEYESINSLFCTSWGLLQPYYTASSTFYRIYLVTDESIHANANTPTHGTNGSYINVGYTAANGLLGSSAAIYKGILAHEYMHGIFYRYGIQFSNDDQQWMHESFASWAGIAYSNSYYSWRTKDVKQFLSTPELSLTYFTTSTPNNLRHYGSCVFPLYIYQNMGGYGPIKKILNAYSSSSDPLTAINSGLQSSGYNLASAYIGCASYNYNTGYFYTGIPSSGSTAWGMAKETKITSFPYYSTNGSLPGLACNYRTFNGTSTSSTLTVTVNYTNNASNAALRTIRKTNSGDYYINTHSTSSGSVTIQQTSFGSSIAKKLTIIPMNKANSSSNVTYTCSASVSYPPASTIYKIKNVGANKCLNVYGNNVTSLSNHKNVTLWSDSGTNEQKWFIPTIGSGVYISSIIDTTYGLNPYRTGSPWNCDLYKIVGNEYDAQVDFIAVTGGYKIKLHNYDYYLTVGASSDGANVYWSASSSSSYQKWTLTPVT